MASNNKNKTAKTANKTANKTNAVNAVDAVVQSEAISELTSLVRSLMREISELKAKANSEIKTTPDNKTTAKVPANKKDHIFVPANKTVNVVPANKFVPIAEGTAISELVTISSIGTPFSSKWGARQAVNCVTANGNTIVCFVNCVRDALGNTIACGLVGGASYVMTGLASGKTSEFNGLTSNIINKAKFAKA
jgi:hypothetical protein